MSEGIAIPQANAFGLATLPSDISSPSFPPPSLKVALSLELAMPHFIPGCTALSDKTGVNSQYLANFLKGCDQHF